MDRDTSEALSVTGASPKRFERRAFWLPLRTVNGSPLTFCYFTTGALTPIHPIFTPATNHHHPQNPHPRTLVLIPLFRYNNQSSRTCFPGLGRTPA